MKEVLEIGKRILISVVGALAILTVVFLLIEWKNIAGGLYSCAVCKEGFWFFPKKVTILDQNLYVCRSCVRMIRELGQQIGSFLG